MKFKMKNKLLKANILITLNFYKKNQKKKLKAKINPEMKRRRRKLEK